MKCEYSFNGMKCGKKATVKIGSGPWRYFVCLKHKHKWQQRINGSMLEPNGKSRQEEREEYGL